MNEPLVTVYSKPACMQCEMTKRAFAKEGVEYRVVDITQSSQALEWITEDLGYAAAPVVFVEDGTGQSHWSGFRPDRIKAAISWVRGQVRVVEAMMPDPKERMLSLRIDERSEWHMVVGSNIS